MIHPNKIKFFYVGMESFEPSPKRNVGYTIILHPWNSTNIYYFMITKENKTDKAALKVKKVNLKKHF